MLPENTDSSFRLPDQTCQSFTLAEILLLTNSFDEALVIGRGGFGKAEVKVLSKLRHGNLVSLLGYCDEGNEMCLIYEFMPNGTLEDHLHKDYTDLSWLQRLKICLGAARGLDYLHTGTSTQHGVIHRDVKSSNILLDANFAAKISDFGLAKVGPINQTRTFVSTGVKGTFGYMDPCYFYSGKLTRKSDVYAFGVVLFEALSGRQAVDSSLDEDQWSLAVWAQDHIKEGKLNQIIDSRLMGQISKKCLKDFANIAGQCLHNQPKSRPTMAEVVVKLESILLQERESSDSIVDEGRFINRVRYFFAGKTEVISTQTVEISEMSEINASSIERFNNQSLGNFTYTELLRATNDFKHEEHLTVLPETIYKGWIDAPTEYGVGLPIYVRKRHIGKSKLDLKPEEFNFLNLVKFFGYCLNEQELLCVYELRADVSLDKLLYGDPGKTSLPWIARLKIAIEAAQGLSFLHQRNYQAYSQFKTAHILVDSNYNARLSNYEVEKSFVALGSYSFHTDAFYAAPEWLVGSHQVTNSEGLWVKSEIYAFGVVLLEILTGLKVYDVNRAEGKQNLVKWAIPLLEDEVNLGMIMDPQLRRYNFNSKGAFELSLLISKCLQPNQEERPSMEQIFQILYLCYQGEAVDFSCTIQKDSPLYRYS
ncbi:mitogen-activated protein kinase kinase kinase [Tanacetum coccineum]